MHSLSPLSIEVLFGERDVKPSIVFGTGIGDDITWIFTRGMDGPMPEVLMSSILSEEREH